jgi:hypothetical protein
VVQNRRKFKIDKNRPKVPQKNTLAKVYKGNKIQEVVSLFLVEYKRFAI